ncbi:MAG: phosphate acyltransferase PlsX [Alphaproteobacteria bacterium]|nr:phosphate acyltransferase PlsX [Alphaproteobacteria bacterium]
MKNKVRIAVDAMGGDNAPNMVIAGAEMALVRYPDVEYLFFGDEKQIKPLIEKHSKLKGHSTVIHTDDVVANHEKPSVALRQGKKSSMALAINAVKKGEADSIISAGNTGALMAMGKIYLRTLDGISRPAITTFFPTKKNEVVVLDLGANIECDESNLVEFAVMGEVFAKTILGVLNPRVALLNIGEEEQKGHEEIKKAAEILKEKEDVDYVGFVEGDDILKGNVDVIVADGFSGNIALKTIEGTLKFFNSMLKRTFKSGPMAILGYLFARKAFNNLRAQMDPRKYNGAVLLGLKGVCVKSHGGTDAFGFSSAISVAHDMVSHNSNEEIIKQIKNS